MPERLRPTLVRVPKTAELVAAQIRRRIALGDLLEGAALPSETALMEEFGVSRPTLREAFRILESEGLISVRRGSRGGARVHVPTSDASARYAGLVLQHRGATLEDVFLARAIVEAPAAALVAARRDRVRCADALRAWLDEHPYRDRRAEALDFHGFNRLLVRLTENETLILITTILESISDLATTKRMRTIHSDDDQLARKARRARQRLIDLIAAGDVDAAEDLWRRHLTEAGRALLGGGALKVIDLFNANGE